MAYCVRTLIDLSWGSKKTWNFSAGNRLKYSIDIQVIDRVILTDETASISGCLFPDDLDTTALALRALKSSSAQTISSVLDLMAEYVNNDGTFQVSRQISEANRVIRELLL